MQALHPSWRDTIPLLPNRQRAWWLLGDTGLRTPSAHASCFQHKRYRLTCKAFEELVARARGCCEICETTGHFRKNDYGKGPLAGRLQLDHDHGLGMWAVRGLLCNTCNSRLDEFSPEIVGAYEKRSFYRAILSRFDLDGWFLPEPTAGAKVFDFAFRPWERTSDGWVARHNWAHNMKPALTWKEMVRFSGPHHLRLAADAA